MEKMIHWIITVSIALGIPFFLNRYGYSSFKDDPKSIYFLIFLWLSSLTIIFAYTRELIKGDDVLMWELYYERKAIFRLLVIAFVSTYIFAVTTPQYHYLLLSPYTLIILIGAMFIWVLSGMEYLQIP